MSILDTYTVLISYAVSNLICTFVIALLWRQYRQRFNGLGFWLADFAMQSGALVLVVLRGIVPELLSIIVSNGLIVGGNILIYIGLGHFIGKRSPQLHNILMLAVLLFAQAYFTLVQPSLTIRIILFSLALLAISLQGAWLMLRRAAVSVRSFGRGVGYVFVVFSLVSIIRAVIALWISPGSDLLHSNIYDTFSVMAYQMTFVLLTFSLFLSVNRRLLADLESDMTARQLAESALRSSEEKFFKAFQSSPDAILISRLSDGRFIDVNDGFCHLSGYSREEALSGSPTDLQLWVSPQDRQHVATELEQHHRLRDYELDFQARSGAKRHCLYSGEIISLEGEAHILSMVRDITERYRAEEIIRLRLRLWEVATTHTVDHLMQKALDEIEVLTGSLIGFYHFVGEDQETLSLQAWSTRTLEEFCQAEGRGMHYPISEAGVWVDCVKQRKPVIHNDYASLPHRKGMPDGHAAVVRELVVPTLRDGQVVAILGVGNKPGDYTEKDVEVVSYIADLVWSIVEQKRVDEEVHRLNNRLERLAMTDDLTGLTNRRAFFIEGKKEIKRAERYGYPFSLLMMDLDRFKSINDSYGHEAGDKMLKCIAKTLQKNIRAIDLVGRLGGEEFGVLLPNTGPEDALRLAERLRQAVEAARCPMRGQKVGVTASIGVSSFCKKLASLDAVLRSADTAMYRAKSKGRNKVNLSEECPPI